MKLTKGQELKAIRRYALMHHYSVEQVWNTPTLTQQAFDNFKIFKAGMRTQLEGKKKRK